MNEFAKNLLILILRDALPSESEQELGYIAEALCEVFARNCIPKPKEPKVNEELLALVDNAADRDYNDFNIHQNSDENKDYVRGFKAGALFSSLKMRTQIYELELKKADKSQEPQIYATTCL
jgi:hypothetical protein